MDLFKSFEKKWKYMPEGAVNEEFCDLTKMYLELAEKSMITYEVLGYLLSELLKTYKNVIGVDK